MSQPKAADAPRPLREILLERGWREGRLRPAAMSPAASWICNCVWPAYRVHHLDELCCFRCKTVEPIRKEEAQ